MSLMYLSPELNEISDEADNARHKFGDQFDFTDEQWLAVLVEEVGEAAKALNERTLDRTRKDPLDVMPTQAERTAELRAEVVQVAAVAARWMRRIEESQP